MSEEDEKYSLPEDTSSKPRIRGSLAKSVESLEVLVDSVKLYSSTRRHLDDNGECDHGLPYCVVSFDTGSTKISKIFILDPFITSNQSVSSSREEFSTLLATAGVSWDRLPELIGSRVRISSESGSGRFKLANPRDDGRNVAGLILEKDIEMLKHPDIEDELVEKVYNYCQNVISGYAEITKIRSRNKKAYVEFELCSGHTFVHEFRLKEKKSSPRRGSWIGVRRTSTSNYASDTQDTYTFWDFCQHVLGYTPTNSDYEELIGSEVAVEYVSGEWFPKHAVEKI